MEHIERDLRIVDLRSTVWVLSTFVVCVAAVYAVAFYNQVNRRTLEDIVFVSDWALTNLYRFIFSLF
jgi:hypothetical protein